MLIGLPWNVYGKGESVFLCNFCSHCDHGLVWCQWVLNHHCFYDFNWQIVFLGVVLHCWGWGWVDRGSASLIWIKKVWDNLTDTCTCSCFRTWLWAAIYNALCMHTFFKHAPASLPFQCFIHCKLGNPCTFSDSLLHVVSFDFNGCVVQAGFT
jgi:hypothetical protein